MSDDRPAASDETWPNLPCLERGSPDSTAGARVRHDEHPGETETWWSDAAWDAAMWAFMSQFIASFLAQGPEEARKRLREGHAAAFAVLSLFQAAKAREACQKDTTDFETAMRRAFNAVGSFVVAVGQGADSQTARTAGHGVNAAANFYSAATKYRKGNQGWVGDAIAMLESALFATASGVRVPTAAAALSGTAFWAMGAGFTWEAIGVKGLGKTTRADLDIVNAIGACSWGASEVLSYKSLRLANLGRIVGSGVMGASGACRLAHAALKNRTQQPLSAETSQQSRSAPRPVNSWTGWLASRVWPNSRASVTPHTGPAPTAAPSQGLPPLPRPVDLPPDLGRLPEIVLSSPGWLSGLVVPPSSRVGSLSGQEAPAVFGPAVSAPSGPVLPPPTPVGSPPSQEVPARPASVLSAPPSPRFQATNNPEGRGECENPIGRGGASQYGPPGRRHTTDAGTRSQPGVGQAPFPATVIPLKRVRTR